MTHEIQGFFDKRGHLERPRDDVAGSGVFDNLRHDPVQPLGFLEDCVQVLPFRVFGRKVIHEQGRRGADADEGIANFMRDTGRHLSQGGEPFRPAEFFFHLFKRRDIDVEALVQRIAALRVLDRDCPAQDLARGPVGVNEPKDVFKGHMLRRRLGERLMHLGAVIGVDGVPDTFRTQGIVRIMSGQFPILTIAENNAPVPGSKNTEWGVVHNPAIFGFGMRQINIQVAQRGFRRLDLADEFPNLLPHFVHHPGQVADFIAPVQDLDVRDRPARPVFNGFGQRNQGAGYRLRQQAEHEHHGDERQ